MNVRVVSTKRRFRRVVRAEVDEARWNGANQRHRQSFIQSFDAFVSCDFEYVFDQEISEGSDSSSFSS